MPSLCKITLLLLCSCLTHVRGEFKISGAQEDLDVTDGQEEPVVDPTSDPKDPTQDPIVDPVDDPVVDPTDPPVEPEVEPRVFDLPTLNVNPDTITLAGFSSGATMSNQLLVVYSNTFKGAALFNGAPFASSQTELWDQKKGDVEETIEKEQY